MHRLTAPTAHVKGHSDTHLVAARHALVDGGPNGPSMSAAQSTAVNTWRTAASTPQTLLVASICGPPAAISCSYRDTGVRCSVVGPFVAGPPALPDYLRDPSRSFDSFFRDLKIFLFSFYWRAQRIRGFAIMRYINLLLTLTLTLTDLRQWGNSCSRSEQTGLGKAAWALQKCRRLLISLP